jgi:hypothetical protein
MPIVGFHQKYVEKIRVPFVSTDGGKVLKLSTPAAIDKWLAQLGKKDQVRLLNPNSFEPLFPQITKTGAKLRYSYWHDTKIPKGSDPDEIARLLSLADPKIFRELKVRLDLNELRRWIKLRRVFMNLRTGMSNGIFSATGRTAKGIKKDLPDYLRGTIFEQYNSTTKDVDELMEMFEERAVEVAKTVPECRILHGILRQESMGTTPAEVLAATGDPSRFPAVSSLWHYSGFHVVDGKAPKRVMGEASDFKGSLRMVMHVWADSAVKVRNYYWRPRYDEYRAKVQAKHPEQSDGQNYNSALRLVCKDVLKEFWVGTRNL